MSRRPLKARLGLAGYVMLLAKLKAQPATIPATSEATGCGIDTMYRLIPDLHTIGRLHIVDWVMEPRARPLAVYAYGPGEDVPPPVARPNGRPVRSCKPLLRDRVSPEVLALGSLLDALEQPATQQELCDATGLHRDTIRPTLQAIVDEDNGIGHICNWTPRDSGGGAWMANYLLGSGRNAKYPNRRVQRSATAKRWRDRVAARKPIEHLLATFAAPAYASNQERRAA